MKLILPAITSALLLSGCILGSRDDIDHVPRSAAGTDPMLTAKATQAVASCMGQAFGTTAESIEGGFSVAAQGGSYRVLAFDDPLKRYATRVDIVGFHDRETGRLAARCLID
ncbi:hypothetical protein [uncultured Sphingomonas sp.]|uniref:hypothetical protein n=1 Tax=uncultured Sphingomonas sp. TaxID=158754 RepID=UPI0035CAB4AE